MKIAVIFLIIGLSSCYNAASVSKTDCLEQLLLKDTPVLLQTLGILLCNYKVAQKQQNGEMFLDFLNQVNVLLGKVGCTINTLLGTHVTLNVSNAEQIADEVAAVLFQFLQGLIAKAMKILSEIPFIGDLVNDQALSQDIRIVGCGVLVDILTFADKVMQIAAEIAGIFAKN
uniref:Uncharacterized LOC116409722 n=1 Tax=Xenopus tropicalis TaxID=8364 RepID=A0A803JQK9_XENTR